VALRKKRVVGLAFVVLLAVPPASVVAQGLTDLGIHKPPTSGSFPYSPPGTWEPGAAGFPAQGATYVDPVFGQTIRRVTDVWPNIGDSTLYAKNGHWNANGTRIVHEPDASGSRNIIDTTTGAVVRSGIPFGGEATFDPNFPDVFYHASGTTLRKYLLSTGTSVTVKDFGASIGGLGGSVDCVDNSGRFFVLNLNGTARVWDAIDANGRLPGDPAYAPQAAGLGAATAGDAGHGGMFSGSFGANFGGGYIGITPSADGVFMTSGTVSWHAMNTTAKTMASGGVDRTPDWNGADHGDVVSASDGNSYFVGVNTGLPGWGVMTWNLTQGGASRLLVRVSNNSNDEHFSGIPRGIWRDWMVVDLEAAASGSTDLGLWEPFHHEIFMVNVLTGAVQRLAHHRSQESAGTYQWMPRISVQWDGTKVAYLSNYGYMQNRYSDLWTVDIGGATNNPLPSVSSLAPNTKLAGAALFGLTVNGSNFVSGAAVRWNGTNRATTVVSGTQLQATILATDIAVAGTAQVSVLNPAPGGGTSGALAFTITPSFAVTVVRAGTGSGTVTSTPSGINCGSSCSAKFATGAAVVLSATPGANSTFGGWSGCDIVVGTQCTVAATATRTVTATFQPTADTTPPTVTITSPTSNPTFTAGGSSLTLGGTASDGIGVTQVTWVNSRGGNGTASGTTTWTVNGILLQVGTNVLTVTARDAAGNTAMDALTVTLNDTTTPTVTITSPTSNPTYTAGGSSLTLGGTASDNVGVTQVTWANNLGGFGTASGTTTWTVSGILLQVGTNVLTVTARDAAGNTAADTLTVTLAATSTFTDNPLMAQTTRMKVVHIMELRAAIDNVRAALGLATFAWTDPTLTPGVTPAKVVHLTELRTAINQAYQAAGRTLPTYSDPSLVAGQTVFKANHLNELRTAVSALQ
jgi:hypothetical protein